MRVFRFLWLPALAACMAGCLVVPSRMERDPAGPGKVVLAPNAAHVELVWSLPCDFQYGVKLVVSEPVSLETPGSDVPLLLRSRGFLPQPSGHSLAFRTLDSVFYAVRATDGSTVWSVPIEIEEPVVLETEKLLYVYVSTGGEGVVRAYDKESGALVWSTNKLPEDAVLAEENLRLYAYNTTMLAAVDARNGQHLWKLDYTTTLDYGARLFKPVERKIRGLHLSRYEVLVDLLDMRKGGRRVYSFDFFSGGLKWERIGETRALSPDEAFIFARRGGYIHAINTESGEMERYYKLDRFDGLHLWVEGGLFIYSSTQRYFDTVATRVPVETGTEELEPEEAGEKAGETTDTTADEEPGPSGEEENELEYIKREIVAVDPLTSDVKWFFE
ncbi:MAG: PQQ-binding-like beta-propeller repeat protein, partial [Planctomycetota bacterium]|nr:PQQ-binding-like beta-propeller repeat protein [Planctomycetota bacterium]